ncbi:putative small secreted protein [Nocardioides ginsengisegetis]|uniref:Putative small secreted protein n=1 Tax=Nocardioides ginsengisegetis TaxID=661491 RepID=A0A7W3J1T6_9ACTN|nr:hypothetical protein [Nocardioides ginsengisegetis]MBA8804579.1 putative small secreted protein [Nocardioides ginsengisegetis]
MSHTTSTTSRRGLALAFAGLALAATTAACGTQQGTDIKDTGSSLSVPRHGAVTQSPPPDATSANLAEHLLQGKKFSPPPAGMRVPD